MAFRPRHGDDDSRRNLISNIHARGVPSDQVALRIACLAGQMMRLETSGMAVKDEWIGSSRPGGDALAGKGIESQGLSNQRSFMLLDCGVHKKSPAPHSGGTRLTFGYRQAPVGSRFCAQRLSASQRWAFRASRAWRQTTGSRRLAHSIFLIFSVGVSRACRPASRKCPSLRPSPAHPSRQCRTRGSCEHHRTACRQGSTWSACRPW